MGRGRKRDQPDNELLEELYELKRLVARRPVNTSAKCEDFEYLAQWGEYGPEGDTWEKEETLPASFVSKFDRDFDLRINLLWTRLRTFFYLILTESKEAEYGVSHTFDSTIEPETAKLFLKFLADRRGGKLKVETAVVGRWRRTWLVIESMDDISDIVALHIDHPENGLGTLRIRFGSARDKNPRAIGAPLLFEYWEPLAVGGRELESGYKLKVTLATWTFINPTGHHDHPPTQNANRLNNSKRGRIVEHVKKLIKEPWATRASWPKGTVRRHGLSQPPQPGVPAWADLPASRWEHTIAEATPTAGDA